MRNSPTKRPPSVYAKRSQTAKDIRKSLADRTILAAADRHTDASPAKADLLPIIPVSTARLRRLSCQTPWPHETMSETFSAELQDDKNDRLRRELEALKRARYVPSAHVCPKLGDQIGGLSVEDLLKLLREQLGGLSREELCRFLADQLGRLSEEELRNMMQVRARRGPYRHSRLSSTVIHRDSLHKAELVRSHGDTLLYMLIPGTKLHCLTQSPLLSSVQGLRRYPWEVDVGVGTEPVVFGESEPEPEGVWEAQLAKLAAYKGKHGDCRVPKGWAEDLVLGMWVIRQREGKQGLARGQPSLGMTAERAARLTALGFDWEDTKPPRVKKVCRPVGHSAFRFYFVADTVLPRRRQLHPQAKRSLKAFQKANENTKTRPVQTHTLRHTVRPSTSSTHPSATPVTTASVLVCSL
jgi:hypothetical protein